MRISDWSSDVCSSDLAGLPGPRSLADEFADRPQLLDGGVDNIRSAGSAASRRRATSSLSASPAAASDRASLRAAAAWRPGSTAQRKNSTIARARCRDRKSVVEGKSVSVRVDLGGRRILKTKKRTENDTTSQLIPVDKNDN